MPAKTKSAPYPALTWNDCLSFIAKIDSLGVQTIATSEIARIYGLKSTQTKSLQYRISTARQYGLIEVQNGAVSLTETATELIHPTVENTLALQQKCFANPPLHQKLLQAYDGKPVPRVDLFENILVKDYGISENAKKTAASCFVQSAESLGLIVGGMLSYSKVCERGQEAPQQDAPSASQERPESHALPLVPIEPAKAPATPSDALYQRVPLRSGGMFEVSIPLTATKAERSYIKKLFNLLMEGADAMDEP